MIQDLVHFFGNCRLESKCDMAHAHPVVYGCVRPNPLFKTLRTRLDSYQLRL